MNMNLIDSEELVVARPFEPDHPGRRNPWDPQLHPKNYNYVQSIIDLVDAEPSRPPKYSEETRLEVFRLRDAGYTLRQIADELGLSKSTACLYLQKRARELYKAKIRQPGTDKLVETHYSIKEIYIGKIEPTKSKK